MSRCLLLLAALPALASTSPPATLRVPEDYPTIQAAIDAASDGDTVRVARGSYPGPFQLKKRLTVASDFLRTGDPEDVGATILQGGHPILLVTSSGATIQGFTFLRGGKALVIDGARRVDVLDCRFLDNGGDQLSFESAGGAVRNCFFRNAGDDNIDIDGDSDPLVERNTLLDAADDNIEMRCQPYTGKTLLRTLIRHNYISGAKSGDGIQLIDYKGTSNRTVRVERNVITRCKWAGIGSLPDGRTKQSDFPDAPRGSPQVEKVYVIHNTIVGNAWGVTGGHAMLLLNNLIVDSGRAATRRILGASAILNTGLWNNGKDHDDTVASRGDLAMAPALDANQRPLEGSPCVDAGLASAAWNGETVEAGDFTGTAPDLGAFEFVKGGLPVVTVAATDASAAERADPGAFTVTRSGATDVALSVAYAVRGTATPGADYVELPRVVTIPAGAASAIVTVTPSDDAAAEGVETVELALTPGPAYALGNPSTASVAIADDDTKLPEVAVAATDATASEAGAEPGVFTITRTGPLTDALVVRYVLGGEARSGVDYAAPGGRVTIPAGAAGADVRIVPIDDAVADEEEVVLTLVASPEYVIGARSGATLTINDDD